MSQRCSVGQLIGLLAGCLVIGLWHPAEAEQLDIELTTQGNPDALVKFVGPNVKDATELTDQGLVIRLPTEKPGRPQVGVETRFWVIGDFEITGVYEIVQMAKPTTGYGLGVMLRLIENSTPARRGFLSRFVHPRHGDVYSTNISTATEKGMENNEVYFPTSTSQGRLQLKREGDTLRFSVAEGEGTSYQELRSESFGDEDLQKVGFLVDTGGAPEHVEVVLRHLSVRGDVLSFSTPVRHKGTIQSIWIITTIITVVLLSGGVGILIVRRYR